MLSMNKKFISNLKLTKTYFSIWDRVGFLIGTINRQLIMNLLINNECFIELTVLFRCVFPTSFNFFLVFYLFIFFGSFTISSNILCKNSKMVMHILLERKKEKEKLCTSLLRSLQSHAIECKLNLKCHIYMFAHTKLKFSYSVSTYWLDYSHVY